MTARGPVAPSGDRPLDRPGEIAGWLLLPAVALIAAVAVDALAFLAALVHFFKAFGHGLETLYRAFTAAIYMAFVGAFLVPDAVAAALFFRKHRWAPSACILILLGRLVMVGLYLLKQHLEPQGTIADAPQFALYAVAGLVGIPYFMVSKRVKLTFTRQDAVPERGSR